MKKKKMELVIASAAGLVFVILLLNNLPKMIKKSPPKPTPVAFAPVAETAAPADKTDTTEKKDLTWGRDPFGLPKPQKTGEEQKTPSAALHLGGIIWDEKKPCAIINDEILARGDTIGGFKVVEISRNKVVLDNGTEKLTLELWVE